MATDLFERLADLPVPPPPETFNTALHQRLNRRLLASHLADFALHGFGFAVWHFAQAVGGLMRLTLTGQLKPRSDDPPRSAP
jgi:hypothetical protein